MTIASAPGPHSCMWGPLCQDSSGPVETAYCQHGDDTATSCSLILDGCPACRAEVLALAAAERAAAAARAVLLDRGVCPHDGSRLRLAWVSRHPGGGRTWTCGTAHEHGWNQHPEAGWCETDPDYEYL